MIKLTSLKAFTLIELLVSMLLLGMILIVSTKAYSYIAQNTQMNELRYLALNKIDSEMSRLVFAYENYDRTVFSLNNNNHQAWDEYFEALKQTSFYSVNVLGKDYGLLISTVTDNQLNVVELKDNNDNPNIVETGDIVGIMGWRVSLLDTTKEANLSLSITYPYKVKNILSNGKIELSHLNGSSVNIQNPDYSSKETINIKTSTKIN